MREKHTSTLVSWSCQTMLLVCSPCYRYFIQKRTAGLDPKRNRRLLATANKIHDEFVSSVSSCCRRSVFAAIDKEDEMKRVRPDVRFGRKNNVLGAESVAIGGDAHIALYGTSARKPIEKPKSANQAAKEVRKKMRLNFKNLANAFRAADADKSGSISPRELRCMVRKEM